MYQQYLPAVPHTPELQRILDLPTRDPVPTYPPDYEDRFRLDGIPPGGPCPHLWPVQLWALYELSIVGGLLGDIPVGGGKTIISLLAAEAMDVNVAALIVPAPLVAKTIRAAQELSTHWRIPTIPGEVVGSERTLHVLSAGKLGHPKYPNLLRDTGATLVIRDEAHYCADRSTASGRRWVAHLQEEADAARKLVALSGTFLDRSILELRYNAAYALGPGSPVPRKYVDIRAWADALDPRHPSLGPPAPPGALVKLGGATPREGFKRRFHATLGVVSDPSTGPNVALNIVARRPEVPAEVNTHLHKLRDTWTTPDGEELTDILAFSRYARTLGLGYYYRRTYPRGESPELITEWLEAGRDWNREVREFLARRARPGLDSPDRLFDGARDGKWKSATWARWSELKGLVRPTSEVVWISDFIVRDAIQWGQEAPGIIWTHAPELGRRIAKAGKWKYFGDGPKANATIELESGKSTIVASFQAHHFGKNLQRFNRSAALYVASGSRAWDQFLGRMHRHGQAAPSIEYTVYLHTPEAEAAFASARNIGEFVSEANKSHRFDVATFSL